MNEMMHSKASESEVLDDLMHELRVVVDDLIHYLGGMKESIETGNYSPNDASVDYDILASSEVSGFMDIIHDISLFSRERNERDYSTDDMVSEFIDLI